MSGTYVIGVDIGTQGTKAAVFDVGGECLARGFRASDLLHPEPGAVEEDPEEQVTAVCESVRECVESSGVAPSRVAGLAIDGQMAGVNGVEGSPEDADALLPGHHDGRILAAGGRRSNPGRNGARRFSPWGGARSRRGRRPS